MLEGDGSLEKELAIDNIIGEKIEIIAPVNSPSLDFNDNEDIPTELSDSSDTHDEGRHLNVSPEWTFEGLKEVLMWGTRVILLE